LLLLDEPAGGLNHDEVADLGALIRAIRDRLGITVLLVEHHMGLVGRLTDSNNVYGYSAAQTMVAVLKASGDNLTRENLMKQAASIHDSKLPMLLPGVVLSTSATDFAPIKQMPLMKFDGTTWQLFGDVISGSGS
jgi:energy-coupling factor transporter ATP-binding protein EcfA2